MIEIGKNNFQVFALFFIWCLAGMYLGPVVYAVVLLNVILFWRAKMYSAIFLGFWLILILSDSLEASMSWAKTLKNLYILILAGIMIVDRRNFQPFVRLHRFFIPFFIFAFISLLESPVVVDGIQRTISYILLFVVVPNYATKIYREKGEWFFKDILMVGFMICALSLAWYFLFPNIAISHGSRLRGLFGNPNGLGLFLIVFFILFSVAINRFPKLFSLNEKRLFYAAIFLCVILSGSRNAIVSIGLFVILSRVFKVSMALGLVLVVTAAGIYQIVSINIVPIIKYLGLEEYLRINTLKEGSGRLIAWQFAWVSIQDYFFMGRGFSYDLHLMRSNYEWLSRAGHEGGVHNSYLILWLNTGLIGVLLYFRGFILLFIRASKNSRLAMPTMVAVLFSINFEPWLAASLNPYTIILLVILTVFTQPEFQATMQAPADENSAEDDAEQAQISMA